MSDDLMKYVRKEDPVGFRSAVHDSLKSKVFDALELKKVETAAEYLDQYDGEEDGEEAEVEESLQGDPRHNPSASADRAAYDAPTDKEIAAAKRRKEALKLGRDRRETAIGKRKMKVVIARGLKHPSLQK
jgi:hypothetical protein